MVEGARSLTASTASLPPHAQPASQTVTHPPPPARLAPGWIDSSRMMVRSTSTYGPPYFGLTSQTISYSVCRRRKREKGGKYHPSSTSDK